MPQSDLIKARLKRAPIAPKVRSDVWDLYESATDEDDLAEKLRGLKMPEDVKADLWYMKFKAGQSRDVRSTLSPNSVAAAVRSKYPRADDDLSDGA